MGHGELLDEPRCGARKEWKRGAGRDGGERGRRVGFGSDPASLGEADERAVGDDQVIEQAHVDQGQRPAELLRDAAVGLAGFGDSRRMLVSLVGCSMGISDENSAF